MFRRRKSMTNASLGSDSGDQGKVLVGADAEVNPASGRQAATWSATRKTESSLLRRLSAGGPVSGSLRAATTCARLWSRAGKTTSARRTGVRGVARHASETRIKREWASTRYDSDDGDGRPLVEAQRVVGARQRGVDGPPPGPARGGGGDLEDLRASSPALQATYRSRSTWPGRSPRRPSRAKARQWLVAAKSGSHGGRPCQTMSGVGWLVVLRNVRRRRTWCRFRRAINCRVNRRKSALVSARVQSNQLIALSWHQALLFPPWVRRNLVAAEDHRDPLRDQQGRHQVARLPGPEGVDPEVLGRPFDAAVPARGCRPTRRGSPRRWRRCASGCS